LKTHYNGIKNKKVNGDFQFNQTDPIHDISHLKNQPNKSKPFKTNTNGNQFNANTPSENKSPNETKKVDEILT